MNHITTNTQRDAVLLAKAEAALLGKKISANSNLVRSYKASLPQLTDFQKQVAIGNMLGDAYLQAQGNNYRLRFEWGGVNYEYALHVFNLFRLYCLADSPREQTRINANNNQVTTWPFETVTHEAFNFLADVFLVDGRKSIQLDQLMKYFTPVSLAYWFMDDGENVTDRNSMILHTQGFTPTEVEGLAAMLKDRYSLECWMKILKGKPVLMISGNSFPTFHSLVSPYIIPSMQRKFPSHARALQP